MKKLLWLLPFLPLFATPAASAQSPALVYCVTASSIMCNPTTNPGIGNQGDQAWQAFGKFNNNFLFIGSLWAIPPGQYVCNPTLATGGIGYCVAPGGGGSCPAGSSGQIQLNNAGVCGGFTPGGDLSFNSGTGAFTVTKTNLVPFGTFATQNAATPPAIGGTTPNAGSFNSLTDTGISGSTQCAQVSTIGLFSGTGLPCGTTQTISSGTSALGTSAIGSGACATVVITSAPGVATSDAVSWSFSASPTSTVGYQPSASGMLTIISYPTAGNVNWQVCNNTAGSITPGAVTLNWRVVR